LRQTLVKDSPEAVSSPPTRWRQAWTTGPRPSADGFVTAIACAPGADVMAVGDRSGCLRLYRRSGELLASRHTDRTADLMEMAFGHHAGRLYLASIDRGNVLRLWDAVDGSPLSSVALTGRRGSHLGLFSIGGRLVASLTGDPWRGVLIDLVSGRKTAKDEFGEHPTAYLNGRPVTVTADRAGDLQVTATPGAPTPSVAAAGFATSGVAAPGVTESAPERPVVCFHSGDRLLAGVIHTHEVAIWDIAEHRIVDVLSARSPVADLAATTDGDLFLLAGGEGSFLEHRPPPDQGAALG
jgi:WD40 repeat protein